VQATKAVVCVVIVLSMMMMVNCGGGSGGSVTPPAPLAISVGVTPASVTLGIPATQSFSATVANSTNSSVLWSVLEGASGGSITSAGIYTAPIHAGSFHVIATSAADSTKSATALITVTAPAPVFSSTPGTSAAEGSSYSYTPVATDPAGTAINFSLSTGPTGATLNSGALSWTPSQTQGRTPNAFTLTATSAAGGTATQQWSVIPTGSIRGNRIITYVTDNGPVDQPGDASAYPIAAYVPNGSSFTKVNGTGTTNGTFMLPNVPSGYYWLQHGSYYFWTSSSTIDAGYDQQGRPGLVTGSGAVNFNLTGATAWQSPDQLHFFSSNANAWSAYAPPNSALGTTSVAGSIAWANPTLDSSQGDRLYVSQLSTRTFNAVPVQVLSNTLGPLAVNVGSGTTSVAGALLAVGPTGSLRANIKGSSFAAMQSDMNPLTVHESSAFALDVQPGGETRGWVGATPDLVTYTGSVISTDYDLGDIPFGSPYPASWKPFVLAQYYSYVPYLALGASTSARLYSYTLSTSTDMPTGTAPFGLLVGPAKSPTIDGSNFFNDHSTASLSPTVSWSAPAMGSATGYRLSIYSLTNIGGNSQFTFLATLYTSKSSLVVPPGILVAGQKYVFKLASVHLPGRDIEKSPYRYSFPYGYSQISSGVVAP
jgi:hypothetical protein